MDISKSIAELKEQPGFVDNVGMVLVHNGVVRSWSRKDGREVVALEVTPDLQAIEKIRQEFLARPGIFAIVIEALAGRFVPGDDLLYIVVAGDVRENVKPVLAEVLDRVKAGPVAKQEIMA
ncbi:MAG: molybdenum cofactor biosynthesis protein MoaE [Thermodesulfobacteriota bacterium]